MQGIRMCTTDLKMNAQKTNTVKSYAIGMDIGGLHITAAVNELNESYFLLPTIRRKPVNGRVGAREIISALSGVIAGCCSQIQHETVKIGIAMPGPVNYEQGLAFMQDQNKYDRLYGLNVKKCCRKSYP